MKVVLFDLGGALIRTADVPEIFRRILEAHRIRSSLEEVSLAHRESEKQLRPEDYVMPSDEFWTRWNLRILEQLRIHENAQSLARTIAEQWWDYSDLELYPDVEETLKQLKNMGLKIGLVTNGFQSDIDQILPRVGLANFFDVTVGVDAVGKTKPSREIFLYALKKLGVSPQEALFVGDQIETDYEGAR
ncbi:MAG: HAD family hydrolase, partial [Candidatus Bathyarchaeia archaeon]